MPNSHAIQGSTNKSATDSLLAALLTGEEGMTVEPAVQPSCEGLQHQSVIASGHVAEEEECEPTSSAPKAPGQKSSLRERMAAQGIGTRN